MTEERRDVRKAKQAIKQAFIDLSIHQDIRKITVSRILELADVSRGTFYAHFIDVYDVQEQVEDELLKECLESMGEGDINQIAEDPYPQVYKCLAFLQNHGETIKSLSANGQNSTFLMKYKAILKQGLLDSAHTLEDDATIAILDACIVGAIVEGALEKMIHAVPLDLETTAKTISLFLSQGLKGFHESAVAKK